ncbi:MAG: glycosyltransferase family 9 protein [Bacteroidales bacterium]|nr:glycosyltransferase family 9 protein [Bacteroidales bacterium]
MKYKRVIISRTDSIGDVVLTLPLVGYLKKKINNVEIIFLGSSYTRPLLECCENVDKIIEWDKIKELPFKRRIVFFKNLHANVIIHVYPKFSISLISMIAGINYRIGTSHRWYHLLFCNKLINLGRKNSTLHEAQLNIMLVKNIIPDFRLPELTILPEYYGIKVKNKSNNSIKQYIDIHKFNLIIHPKSKGSAREWGLHNYSKLVKLLPANLFNIIITGTEKEASQMEYFLKVNFNKVKDTTGKLSLTELIELIGYSDALLACSTGPLHIAAALGKLSIGLYSPIKPLYPQRWAPIGKNTKVYCKNIECNKCKNSDYCECIQSIAPEEIANFLIEVATQKLKKNFEKN